MVTELLPGEVREEVVDHEREEGKQEHAPCTQTHGEKHSSWTTTDVVYHI